MVFNKQVKECYTKERNIIFIKNKEEIIGVSCLKKILEEKKICTLYIDNNYRKQGIGTLLLDESMKYLETTKPLVSITENNLPMFNKIIEKYDWKLTKIEDNIFNKEIKEYYFN